MGWNGALFSSVVKRVRGLGEDGGASMKFVGLILVLAALAGCSNGPPPPTADDVPEIGELSLPDSTLIRREFSPESSGVGLDDRRLNCRNASSTSTYTLSNPIAAGVVIDFYKGALPVELSDSYVFDLPQSDRRDRLGIVAHVSTFENGVEHFERITQDNESVPIRKYKVTYEIGFDDGDCKERESSDG